VTSLAAASCSSDGESTSSDASAPGIVVEPSGTAPLDTGVPDPDVTDPDATDHDVTVPPSDVAGRQPEGFTTVTARITDADGEECDVCLWLADSGDERGRGLMGVTDLGDAVGMAFVFEQPLLGSFYMFQTPTPLSIAWFDSDGEIVGNAEMEPCLDTPAGECPLYAPDDEYDLAIEAFAGGLEPLGIGEGARVVLLDGTESEQCLIATG
jgi:uncharacterized membrane protein (UPF0127 family)